MDAPAIWFAVLAGRHDGGIVAGVNRADVGLRD
jgi:hypothetical protein